MASWHIALALIDQKLATKLMQNSMWGGIAME
jgi:hypothetical protein